MKTAVKILAALGTVASGVAVTAMLVAFKDKGTPQDVEPPIPVVTAVSLERGSAPASVHATGQVQARKQVVIVPQISGKVLSVAEHLEPGGRFGKGERFAQVDARDYRAQLSQAEAALAAAELELSVEQGRQVSAKREWELVGGQGEGALARREPHLQVAQANKASAEAGVDVAKANLGRTTLSAPFPGVVLSESLDVGQVVGPSTQAVTFAGTEAFRVQVSVPVDQLGLVDIPGVTSTAGSSVTVTQPGADVKRSGRVVGMAGSLDTETRTATLLVDVPNPLDPPPGQLPLLLGAFVDVEIQGREVQEAVAIPREALRDGGKVFVAQADNTLHIEEVQVAWSGPERVFVLGEFGESDRVVTSSLSYPLEGMALQVQE